MALIKVTSPSFSRHPDLQREILESFPRAVLNHDGQRYSNETLIEYLSDAEGAVIGLEEMNRSVLEALPNLKVMAKYGVGLNNIDIGFAESLGKSVNWTPGVNKRSVAEQTLGFMLGLCRNLFVRNNELKQGHWNKMGGMQLSGKTVGLIGCGNIGEDLIGLLQPFNCRVIFKDILDKSHVERKYGAQQVDTETVLREADIVSMHVPMDQKTANMINRDSIKTMKSGAFIINTSRGGLVDQNALKEALISGQLGGAALDVFSEEPPTDISFLSLPNLVVTPHIGGNAQEAILAMGRAAIGHLKSYFECI